MRLFIAVPLPEKLKVALREFQPYFPGNGIRFIPEENLHLTLHFTGDTPAEKLPELLHKLTAVSARNTGFTLTFQETAPGPKLNFPRLIWTRFQEHPAFDQLGTELCRVTEAAPGAFGKFIPHITLARFRKDLPKPQALPVIREANIPDLQVHSFALWQSELRSPHPVYSILQEFPLQSSGIIF
jgi:2'-5' RNA ligase